MRKFLFIAVICFLSVVLFSIANAYAGEIHDAILLKVHIKYIESLIARKPTVINEKDELGRTPLFYAFRTRRYDVADLLISRGADFKATDNDGRSLLHLFAGYYDPSGLYLMKIFVSGGLDVNAPDKNGATPLHHVADSYDSSNKEYLRFLILQGADVRMKDKDGDTPLHLVEDKVKANLLISSGADINAKNNKGRTPLHFLGEAELVEYLIASGAQVDAVNDKGWTPLFNAAEADEKGIAEILLKHGANPNTRDNEGKTPLHIAYSDGNWDVSKALLAAGAKKDIKDNKGKTPEDTAEYYKETVGLFRALKADDIDKMRELIKKYPEIVNVNFLIDREEEDRVRPLHCAKTPESAGLLIDNGADIEAKSYYEYQPTLTSIRHFGLTPLQAFSAIGKQDIVTLLLDRGANINASTEETGDTALFLALVEDNRDIAQLLISRGCDVNKQGRKGYSPLHLAAEKGDLLMSLELLYRGARVDAKDEDGTLPLHQACGSGNSDLAKLLIDKGSPVDEKNRSGETPLFAAVLKGNLSMVELLLAGGANIQAKTDVGNTLLHYVSGKIYRSLHDFMMNKTDPRQNTQIITEEKVSIIKLLVSRGLKVDEKNNGDLTPFQMATLSGNLTTAKVFLSAGADINARSFGGSNALHLYLSRPSPDIKIVEFLVKNGIDVNARIDEYRLTPLHMAVLSRQGKIAELLLKNGANPNLKAGSRITAMDIARGRGYNEIVEILKRYEKKGKGSQVKGKK